MGTKTIIEKIVLAHALSKASDRSRRSRGKNDRKDKKRENLLTKKKILKIAFVSDSD